MLPLPLPLLFDAGVTVTPVLSELPFSEAVTVTAWFDVTVPAVATNAAEATPAATVTEAGTVSTALLDETATTEPPAGAALDNVTVQVDVAVDATVEGEQVTSVTVTVTGAVTDNTVLARLPFSEALTVTV